MQAPGVPGTTLHWELWEPWRQMVGQTDIKTCKTASLQPTSKDLVTYPQIFQRFSCWIRLVFVDFIGMGILILLPWLLFDMIPWSRAHVVTLFF